MLVTMSPRGFLLAAAVLLAGTEAVSCTRDLTLRGRAPTRLILDLGFPVTGRAQDFASTCANAQSLLVSISTSGAGIDYRFLLGTDGSLYGCGAGTTANALPCDDPRHIQATLSAPRVVLVEGITLAPGEYRTSANGLDVVCRGVADERIGMGNIVLTDDPTERGTLALHAHVPMLRVGDVNGTFGLLSPSTRHAASATLPVAGRTSNGGLVIVGGGLDETAQTASPNVWEFEPWNLAFVGVSLMSAPRYALSATAVIDSRGGPAVLFAGGLTHEGTASGAADLWRRGAPDEALSMLYPRGFHAAAPLSASIVGPPVVAILGGADDSAGGGAHTEYELFYASVPPATPGCGAPTGFAGFCAPNAGTSTGKMADGHGEPVVVRLDAARALVGGGFSGTLNTIATAWLFDANGGGSFTSMPPLPEPVRAGAALSFPASHGYVGGARASANFNATSKAVVFDGSTRTLAAASSVPRAFATATSLLDGRILLAGGRNDATPSGLASLELFTPAGSSTGGSFALAENMFAPRWGHVATRIDGSATWLNGAVVIAGGAPDAEIFVPAYRCAGTLPTHLPDGAPAAGVDYCDRGRILQILTDPSRVRALPLFP